MTGREMELYDALISMMAEWDKATRYGSPMAKAANENVAYARNIIAKFRRND